MNQNVNLFTVRRTEAAPERPIDWAHDFPGIIDLSSGGELVRDNRRRLTINERRARHADRMAIRRAENRGVLVGALYASGFIFSAVVFILQVI